MEIMYIVPDNLASPANFIIDGAFRQPCLWVNSKGERFMNEDGIPNTTFAGNALATQPGKLAYSIFDSALLEKYRKKGPDIQSHVHPLDMYEHLEEAIDSALAAGYKHVFRADTVEGLAEKMGVRPETLAETVDEYNALCASGFDELFEKDHAYLQPISKPPFYACRYFPSAYGTLGGIKIDYKAEVLDDNSDPIPGLHAAGLDACTIYGDSYPFILPGNSMGFALNSGRIAGESAARL
jgi:fumarate reductase flavoprotein subunit